MKKESSSILHMSHTIVISLSQAQASPNVASQPEQSPDCFHCECFAFRDRKKAPLEFGCRVSAVREYILTASQALCFEGVGRGGLRRQAVGATGS